MESPRSSLSSSPVEERRLIDSWEPEPLVPDVDAIQNQYVLNPPIVTSKSGKYITIDNVKYLNLGTNNYLGLADHPKLEIAAIEAVKRYGIGSCGPRAFYGTMDVHLKLEEELASFLEVQEAVLYSFGFSTIASAIPAYAKSADIIFVDEAVNFAIQQGMVASRSRIIKFRHNDMKHLRQMINEVEDKQTKQKRTFLIVEGIYAKTGDICPLDELIEIKKRHKIRLFIDESRSFGVLGSRGRGVTEHFNMDINDVDLIMASLENALCAYGGFCAGSTFIVDHQRLAGAGYCFSASLPPFQTQVALESLNIIRDNPSIVRESQELYRYAHGLFTRLSKLKNISHELSPFKLLVLKNDQANSEQILAKICSHVMAEDRIAISVSRYLEEEEMTRPAASIRVNISGCLVRKDVDRLAIALDSACLGLED